MFKTLTKWVSNVVNLVKKTAKQLVGYVVSAFKPKTNTTRTTTKSAPVAPKATKVVKEEATTIRSAIKQPATTEKVVVELVLVEDEATVIGYTTVKELTTQWIPDPPSKPPP